MLHIIGVMFLAWILWVAYIALYKYQSRFKDIFGAPPEYVNKGMVECILKIRAKKFVECCESESYLLSLERFDPQDEDKIRKIQEARQGIRYWKKAFWDAHRVAVKVGSRNYSYLISLKKTVRDFL